MKRILIRARATAGITLVAPLPTSIVVISRFEGWNQHLGCAGHEPFCAKSYASYNRQILTLGQLENDVDDSREIRRLSVPQSRLETNLARGTDGRFVETVSQALDYPQDS